MVYLAMLSVGQTMQNPMGRLLTNDEQETLWKEAVVAHLE
jgi:hypothetical protein